MLHFSCSIANMVIIEKNSLQSRFSHYDTKNALLYAFPLSQDRNQSLIVIRKRHIHTYIFQKTSSSFFLQRKQDCNKTQRMKKES